MTQTNTDYLLQITTAVTDRTYGAPAANDGADKFNDHLSQAATVSGDGFPIRSSSLQRTDTARYGNNDSSWTTSGSKQNDHSSDNSTSSRPAPTEHDESPGAVREPNSAADDSDVDSHQTDESDDSTAAEVAGAGQTTTNNTKKTDSNTEPKTTTDSAAAAKAAAVVKKAATEIGDSKAKASAAGRGSSSTPVEAATQHAAEAAELAEKTAIHTPTTDEQAGETQTTVSEGKRTKTAKSGTPAAKTNKGNGVNSDGACEASPIDETEAKQLPSEAAQKPNLDAEARESVADATNSKTKSDTDEASDDDVRTGSPNDGRGNTRGDATGVPNKLDTAQLAASTPGTTNAGANNGVKGKDNERAAKPIAAKGEPVAAAFARMTRNNITGSSDSTPGANDLPQVDPSRFIGRVAKAFQTAQDRGGTLQLRLSPPELGALRIELNVKDGVMSASLQTENANARRLLLDHLPALRDRLAEQNIRVDRFDVDVRQEGSGGQADTRGSLQQQFQHQPDQPAPRRQLQPQPQTRDVAAEKISISPNVSDAGLNLIV